MTDLPNPFTPVDCDLRDFPRMMIDIPRLRASAFDATLNDTAWRAALNLWMSSWHGSPAASLPADEASLCKAAGMGREAKAWRKVCQVALHGWVPCSDGRYYHATVAEMALEAWLEKLAQRLASGAGNAKRWGSEFDPSSIRDSIRTAAGMLAALNPQSKSLPKALRRLSGQHPNGIAPESQTESHRDANGSPDDVLLRSLETGTGNLRKEGKSHPGRTIGSELSAADEARPSGRVVVQ